TYQVVIAIDVLEHLVAPQVFIQQVSGMLPRDGILILQTPNVKSLRRFIQGAGWEQYRPDEHPLLYSSKALRHILTRAGFIMLHMKTISGTAVESNGRSGWLRGVQKVLNSLHGGNTLWVACRKAAI
ncbi:MAG: methyltransferase domain-containing protein, partial [Candidatus Omnitrophica bacterium]|nr:methyltransferase domain-containing protein [Candidatus Omnitrophota bacterium]